MKRKIYKKKIIDIRDDLCLDIMCGMSSGAVLDKSEKANVISLINAPTTTNAAGLGSHYVLDLDGVNQLLETPDQAHFDVDVFSVVMLFRIDALGQTNVIMTKKHSLAPWYTWAIGQWGDNKMYFEGNRIVGGATNFQSDGTLAADKWYLLAVTRNASGKVLMYINNEVQTNSIAASSELIDSDEVLAMGASHSGADLLNGKVAMFRMYEKCLSAEELDRIYKWTHQRFGVLIGYQE